MKSPFIVVQDFLSPQTCERIVKDINVLSPDTDINGDPKKLERFGSGMDWKNTCKLGCCPSETYS